MKLEQFITDHRDAFDTEVPSAAIWEAIATRLPSEQAGAPPNMVVKPRFSFMRSSTLLRVAAAVALLAIAMGVGVRIGEQKSTVNTEVAASGLHPDFDEATAYYQRDISTKKEKLAQFASHSHTVETDIIQLEQVMADLKAELDRVPPARRQEVLTAMIENYKTRASILERVLSHIEQQQHNSKDKNDEKEHI